MKTLFFIFLLCTLSNFSRADDDTADRPTDYGALTNSLMYLNKKWVDEPAARDQQLKLQEIARPVQNPYMNQNLAPSHVPTCYQVPMTSYITGMPMGFRTICQ